MQWALVKEGAGKQATLGLTIEHVDGVDVAYKRGLSAAHSVYLSYRENFSVVVVRNSLSMTDEIGHSLLLGLTRSSPSRLQAVR